MITWKPNAIGDILVGSTDEPVICTWFGGNDDPEDNGSTASGLSTKNNPDILGCALPIPTYKATEGSPLPKMPYLITMVEVWTRDYSIPDPSTGFAYTMRTITVPLIDVGPALDTNHAIDLTVAAFQKLGGNLNNGKLKVAFRIIGAAQYLI